MIIFDVPLWHLLNLLAGTVFPLLVGLVTTRETNSGRKAVYLVALSVGTNLATELGRALETGQAYNLGLALLSGLTTFIIGVAVHYGLWKPTGLTDKALNHGKTDDVTTETTYDPESGLWSKVVYGPEQTADSEEDFGDGYPHAKYNSSGNYIGDIPGPDRVPDGPDHRAE